MSIGISLSGGGIRATLFHFGVILALKKKNLLKDVVVINGVSGGAIAAAYVKLNWDLLCSDRNDLNALVIDGMKAVAAADFRNNAIIPWVQKQKFLKDIFQRTIPDVNSELTINLVKLYKKVLKPQVPIAVSVYFDKKKAEYKAAHKVFGAELFSLERLPDLPFNGDLPNACLQTYLKLFTDFVKAKRDTTFKEFYEDYSYSIPLAELPGNPVVSSQGTITGIGKPVWMTTGGIHNIKWLQEEKADASRINVAQNTSTSIGLAESVVASSAFPPLFPSLKIKFPMEGDKIPSQYIADGGIYDNSGLSFFLSEGFPTASLSQVILSDASSPFEYTDNLETESSIDRTVRTTNVLMKRVSDFDRELFQKKFSTALSFVSISICDNRPKFSDVSHQEKVSQIRTDLDKFSADEISEIVRQGYFLTLDNASIGRPVSDFTLPQFPVKPAPPLDASAVRNFNEVKTAVLAKFSVMRIFISNWKIWVPSLFVVSFIVFAIFQYFYFENRIKDDLYTSIRSDLNFIKLVDKAPVDSGSSVNVWCEDSGRKGLLHPEIPPEDVRFTNFHYIADVRELRDHISIYRKFEIKLLHMPAKDQRTLVLPAIGRKNDAVAQIESYSYYCANFKASAFYRLTSNNHLCLEFPEGTSFQNLGIFDVWVKGTYSTKSEKDRLTSGVFATSLSHGAYQKVTMFYENTDFLDKYNISCGECLPGKDNLEPFNRFTSQNYFFLLTGYFVNNKANVDLYKNVSIRAPDASIDYGVEYQAKSLDDPQTITTERKSLDAQNVSEKILQLK